MCLLSPLHLSVSVTFGGLLEMAMANLGFDKWHLQLDFDFRVSVATQLVS